MQGLWGSVLLLGKVGKGTSGEGSVAERDQWEPGTGQPRWGRGRWRGRGSVIFSFDGGVGKRQWRKACERWGGLWKALGWVELLSFFQCTAPTQDLHTMVWLISSAARSFSSPSISHSLSAPSGLKEKERMEERREERLMLGGSEQVEMGTGPSPLLWNLQPFWCRPREKLQK